MNLIWSKYENAVYMSENKSLIDCNLTVTSPPLGVIPFTAKKDDSVEYGRKLYEEIVANANTIPIGPYVPKVVANTTPSSGNNSGPTVI